MPMLNDTRIRDDECKMLSTVLDNIESQINGSYFYHHSIHALNFWHFNRSEEGTYANVQFIRRHFHSSLVCGSGLTDSLGRSFSDSVLTYQLLLVTVL